NLISSVVKDLNLKRNNLADNQQVLMTELARLSESYLTSEMQKKIEVISKSIYSADVRGKRKLIRSLYDRIIVLDKYEIQLIIKEASDSGALLFEVLPYRGRVKLDNLTYLKRLYLDEDMSLNEL